MSTIEVAIPGHTTGAEPSPHIIYEVLVIDGEVERTVRKRYSDFTQLQDVLKTPYALPPKRILTTAFRINAWADSDLIEERIIGLYQYLVDILADATYATRSEVKTFLEVDEDTTKPFDPEDAIPSTLSASTGAAIAAQVAAAALDSAEPEAGQVPAQSGDVEAAAPLQRHGTYYPDWSSGQLPPENLWFGKFDIIYFAFAIPTSSSTISIGSTSLLRRLVTAAKASGKGSKIVLSVGGWGGSQYFSQSVNSSSNRSKFINSMASAVRTYGLAGLDIDWEYPNSAGAGNPHSPNDAANFLTFLQGLRANLGASAIISSAVPHNPWLGSNGKPLTNVSAYAAQMSWVNIMNYDVWGASSTPGPNAPLGNACGTSKQPGANAKAAFSAWTKAGFPASKLFLGLPLYGYVSRSTKTVLTGAFVDPSTLPVPPVAEDLGCSSQNNASVGGVKEECQPCQAARQGKVVLAEDTDALFLDGAHPRSNPYDGDVVHAEASLSGWIGQQIPFGKLVSLGALKAQADGSYVGAGGFKRGWDTCSTTPFLYNTSQSTFVSYDDPQSLAAKAEYARSVGMGGTFTWSIDEDDIHELTDSIRTAGGRAPPPS